MAHAAISHHAIVITNVIKLVNVLLKEGENHL